MQGGKITQNGTYQELLTAGTAFEQLVNAHKEVINMLGPSNEENQTVQSSTVKIEEPKESHNNVIRENSQVEISEKQSTGIQLTEEEEKETGDVGWKSFWDYIVVSKGLVFLSLSVISQSSFVALQAAATYWLAIGIQFPNLSSGTLIEVYTGISLLSAFFVYLRSFFAAHLGLKASKAYFSGITNAIFKAPMLFFDSTPVGRILTRVSSFF